MHVVWRFGPGRDDANLVACEVELLLHRSHVLHRITSGSPLSTV